MLLFFTWWISSVCLLICVFSECASEWRASEVDRRRCRVGSGIQDAHMGRVQYSTDKVYVCSDLGEHWTEL